MHRLAPVVLFAGTLAGQTTAYSPAAFATVEGSTSSTLPFSSAPFHVLQVHGDLRGSVNLYSSIAFRRDGVSTATTGLSRTIDMEMFAGEAVYPNIDLTFAANFVMPRVPVVMRRMVNTPNWQIAASTPAPFDFTIPFDVPYLNSGLLDFAWELLAYSNSGTSTDLMRADATLSTFTQSGSQFLGTECTATGQTTGYQLLGSMRASANGELLFIAQGLNLPAGTTANVLMIGATNPNLTVPGLCAPITSSGEVILPMPPAPTGFWTSTLYTFPHLPAFVGAHFIEQAASYDPGQPGIPIVLTRGRDFTIAGLVTGNVSRVRRVAFNSVTVAEGSASDTGIIIRLN